jgi:hypothetical protein
MGRLKLMFILNSKSIKNKIGFSKKVSDYLEKNGVPILAIDGDIYYFTDGDLLTKVLDSSPFWVKWSKRFS